MSHYVTGCCGCCRVSRNKTHVMVLQHYCRSLQQKLCRATGCNNLICLHRGLSQLAHSGPPAFVFDIDGVLIRGKQILPAARRALAKLYTDQGRKPLYPVCFLTNGGGVTESHKAQQLTHWLGVHVSAQQVVLSHTPFRSLVPALKDSPVLACGRGNVLELARSYGFMHPLSTDQVAGAHPAAVPFVDAGSLDKTGATGAASEVLNGSMRLEAVLIFCDPSNWYIDLQVVTDVILSGGRPTAEAGPAPPPAPVPLYFSNPDLLWTNEHPLPRFGQGAFAAALDALHQRVTGRPLPRVTYFGKPNPEPYKLATALLLQQSRKLGLLDQGFGPAQPQMPFSAVYAIGDNPASDIRGARRAGPPFVPVLVRTGVFSGPPGSNDAGDPADLVVQDVEAAVEAVLHWSRHASS